jgi:hypothetical protein
MYLKVARSREPEDHRSCCTGTHGLLQSLQSGEAQALMQSSWMVLWVWDTSQSSSWHYAGFHPSTHHQPWKREDQVTSGTSSNMGCHLQGCHGEVQFHHNCKASIDPWSSLVWGCRSETHHLLLLWWSSSPTLSARQACHREKLSHRDGCQKHSDKQKMWHQEMHFLCYAVGLHPVGLWLVFSYGSLPVALLMACDPRPPRGEGCQDQIPDSSYST